MNLNLGRFTLFFFYFSFRKQGSESTMKKMRFLFTIKFVFTFVVFVISENAFFFKSCIWGIIVCLFVLFSMAQSILKFPIDSSLFEFRQILQWELRGSLRMLEWNYPSSSGMHAMTLQTTIVGKQNRVRSKVSLLSKASANIQFSWMWLQFWYLQLCWESWLAVFMWYWHHHLFQFLPHSFQHSWLFWLGFIWVSFYSC